MTSRVSAIWPKVAAIQQLDVLRSEEDSGIRRVWMKKWWPKIGAGAGRKTSELLLRPSSVWSVNSSSSCCFLGYSSSRFSSPSETSPCVDSTSGVLDTLFFQHESVSIYTWCSNLEISGREMGLLCWAVSSILKNARVRANWEILGCVSV